MPDYFEKKEKQADRDERPSWRERDARNNKNPYSSYQDEGIPRTSREELSQQREAKQALDEAFRPQKNKKQAMEWTQLTQSKPPVFEELAHQYIEDHGIPRDIDDLIVLLGIKNIDDSLRILDQIDTLLPELKPGKKELLMAKLRADVLSETDADKIDAMQEIIAKLTA